MLYFSHRAKQAVSSGTGRRAPALPSDGKGGRSARGRLPTFSRGCAPQLVFIPQVCHCANAMARLPCAVQGLRRLPRSRVRLARPAPQCRMTDKIRLLPRADCCKPVFLRPMVQAVLADARTARKSKPSRRPEDSGMAEGSIIKKLFCGLCRLACLAAGRLGGLGWRCLGRRGLGRFGCSRFCRSFRGGSAINHI